MAATRQRWKWLLIIGLPVVFALIMQWAFDNGDNAFAGFITIMSVGFMFFVPMGLGALTIRFSDINMVKILKYRIFMPWLPVLIFMLLTLMASMEGWACWLMALPIFLIMASIGGLLQGKAMLDANGNDRVYVSIFALLPFIIAPIEKAIGGAVGQFEAYTSIDITAPKEDIWPNVTRVRAIQAEQDKGWLTNTLGFPRPIKAELNYEGVGAYRKAIFDKGLVFHETVTSYDHQKQMSFTIKANPYEIPSTTMDEHVVIGGNYFDVLDGNYALENLGDGKCRLHLTSHFQLNTTFNFYAGWWAGWIMKDIQNNILQVIKARSEENHVGRVGDPAACRRQNLSLALKAHIGLPPGQRPGLQRKAPIGQVTKPLEL